MVYGISDARREPNAIAPPLRPNSTHNVWRHSPQRRLATPKANKSLSSQDDMQKQHAHLGTHDHSTKTLERAVGLVTYNGKTIIPMLTIAMNEIGVKAACHPGLKESMPNSRKSEEEYKFSERSFEGLRFARMELIHLASAPRQIQTHERANLYATIFFLALTPTQETTATR